MRYEDIDKEALVKKVGNDIAVKMLMRDFPKEHKAFLAEQAKVQDSNSNTPIKGGLDSEPTTQGVPSTQPPKELPAIDDLDIGKIVAGTSPKEAFNALSEVYPNEYNWDSIAKDFTNRDRSIDYGEAIKEIQDDIGRFKPTQESIDDVKAIDDTLSSVGETISNIGSVLGIGTASQDGKGIIESIGDSLKDKQGTLHTFTKGLVHDYNQVRLGLLDIAEGLGADVKDERDKVINFSQELDNSIKDKSVVSGYSIGKMAPLFAVAPELLGSSLARQVVLAGSIGATLSYTDSRLEGETRLDSMIEGAKGGLLGGVSVPATVGIGIVGMKTWKAMSNVDLKPVIERYRKEIINTDGAIDRYNKYKDEVFNPLFTIEAPNSNRLLGSKTETGLVDDDAKELMTLVSYAEEHSVTAQGVVKEAMVAGDSRLTTNLESTVNQVKDEIAKFKGKETPDEVINKVNDTIVQYGKTLNEEYNNIFIKAKDVKVANTIKESKLVNLEQEAQRIDKALHATTKKDLEDVVDGTITDDLMETIQGIPQVTLSKLKNDVKSVKTLDDMLKVHQSLNQLGLNKRDSVVLGIHKVKESVENVVNEVAPELSKTWKATNAKYSTLKELQKTPISKLVDEMTPTIRKDGTIKHPVTNLEVGLSKLETLTEKTGDDVFIKLREVAGDEVADKFEVTMISNALNTESKEFTLDRLATAMINKSFKGKEINKLKDFITLVQKNTNLDKVVSSGGSEVGKIVQAKADAKGVLSHAFIVKSMSAIGKLAKVINPNSTLFENDIRLQAVMKVLENKKNIKKVANIVIKDN